jgi:hypothetical protein
MAMPIRAMTGPRMDQGVLLSPGSLFFARSTRRPVRHSRVSSDETAALSEKSSECPARGRVGELRLGHVAPIARCHSSASVSINSASVARV